jgi:hypothetical protein
MKYDTVTLEPSKETVLVNNKVMDSEEQACIAIILSSICANKQKRKTEEEILDEKLVTEKS